MNDEETYGRRKPVPPPVKRNWRAVALYLLEFLGVLLIAAGAALYEFYLGPIIIGVYLVYVASVTHA